MKSLKRTCSLVVTSAVLVLLTVSCKDSPTSASRGAAGSPINIGADASLSQTRFAREACGVIAGTLVITENTRLTCDVVCTTAAGPCIQFGKDHITLWLNGFTMSGPAMPPTTNCAASPGASSADGISTATFDRVRIRGPGMVQTFSRHGIFVSGSEKVTVEGVTSHYNCYSGIFMGASHNNDITGNVAARNGSASGVSPCGGNCITNSNNNRIRRNHFYGNGSIAGGGVGPFLGIPNDFGVGLVGTSSGNVVEENSIGGNINGVLLFNTAIGNLIRRNIIAGNPPVQVSGTASPPVGVDIRDASPAGANTFEANHCITYEGTTNPPPCPNFSTSRRHGWSDDD